jgi:hypothetical protein
MNDVQQDAAVQHNVSETVQRNLQCKMMNDFWFWCWLLNLLSLSSRTHTRADFVTFRSCYLCGRPWLGSHSSWSPPRLSVFDSLPCPFSWHQTDQKSSDILPLHLQHHTSVPNRSCARKVNPVLYNLTWRLYTMELNCSQFLWNIYCTMLGHWWTPKLARLLMTPFNLLHWFIYDSMSRHYNLSLQWVLTLWCLVSERSFDLFFFRMLAANWLTISNWLLAAEIYPLKRISRTGYRTPSLTVVSSVATVWLLRKLNS